MTAREIAGILKGKCQFTFARSGGPGGQNVNKVETRAVARLRLADLAFLGGERRKMVANRLANRINAQGEIVISVQDTREQSRNREIAMERMAGLISAAMKRPPARKRTRPSAAAREARLRAKKHASAAKKRREPPHNSDE